jgi:hypothetical protein
MVAQVRANAGFEISFLSEAAFTGRLHPDAQAAILSALRLRNGKTARVAARW